MDLTKYYHAGTNRVEGIRTIRLLTGLGLKDAKDLHDSLVMGKVEKITIDPATRTQTIRELGGVFILAH
jgi:ribosomal protein L7/L12